MKRLTLIGFVFLAACVGSDAKPQAPGPDDVADPDNTIACYDTGYDVKCVTLREQRPLEAPLMCMDGPRPERGCDDPEPSCGNSSSDGDLDGVPDGIDCDCVEPEPEPEPAPPAQICGNGVVEGLEQCDDGNVNPFDGCDRCILVDTTIDKRNPGFAPLSTLSR